MASSSNSSSSAPSLPAQTPTTNVSSSPRTLRIGTRASALALAQTELFRSLLARTAPTVPTTVHPMTTAGDHNQTTPLHALATNTPGGKSLWTHELEARLLAGELDCIVHSLKDVPTTLVPGCAVRTAGPRHESRDCVVMRSGRHPCTTLADLPPGSVVGTSSLRRAAMIRRRWPDLVITDVRGNVGTRLAKLEDESKGYDALVLAGAGVQRLGFGHRVSSWLSGQDGMLAAVGQGALGIEFLEGDKWVRDLVDGVEEKRVGWACVAERGLLAELEGGCSVPVGVETEWEDEKGEEEEDKHADENNNNSHNHNHQTTSTPTQQTKPTPSPSSPPNPTSPTSTKPPPQPHHSVSSTSTSTSTSSAGGGGTFHLTALIVSPDGKDSVSASRREYVGSDAEADRCGRELARELVGRGAGRILEGIYRERREEGR